VGIRIEDNILITSDGHQNLTSHAPKTVEQIEAVMAS
jgi:Xaa-Pro aminopeptidase